MDVPRLQQLTLIRKYNAKKCLFSSTHLRITWSFNVFDVCCLQYVSKFTFKRSSLVGTHRRINLYCTSFVELYYKFKEIAILPWSSTWIELNSSAKGRVELDRNSFFKHCLHDAGYLLSEHLVWTHPALIPAAWIVSPVKHLLALSVKVHFFAFNRTLFQNQVIQMMVCLQVVLILRWSPEEGFFK